MLNNTEILKVAEVVSQEKGIEMDIVMEALEESFEIIGKSKYGMENNIKASIDRLTGNISMSHIKDVVETIDPVLQSNQILLDQAKKYDANTEVGKQVTIPLPAVNFGRVTANMARQVIYSRVREAEKRRQFNDFKDRVGEVLSGIVKRIEFGNIIVDLGKAEGFLRKDELIPRENFKTGDRIRAYFFDIKEEAKGHQIFLSRTHPQFMAKLFVQEVPEIYEGQIEILSVARDPGSRGKITVRANDKSIDPVGACVGMRGSRVQAIVNELQG
jgi:N utilization substance protein A